MQDAAAGESAARLADVHGFSRAVESIVPKGTLQETKSSDILQGLQKSPRSSCSDGIAQPTSGPLRLQHIRAH